MMGEIGFGVWLTVADYHSRHSLLSVGTAERISITSAGAAEGQQR